MKRLIYFAAPLFTQAERFWNIKLAETIMRMNNDFIMILPQKECNQTMLDPDINFQNIFNICIEGIDKCEIVLAILEGADSESGTCFECGYGFAKNKRLIGVRTDRRKGEDQGLNAMLSQSCELIRFDGTKDSEDDIERLAEIIINKIIN
jgi:nucleoside 2-deoxyribosyltransferase